MTTEDLHPAGLARPAAPTILDCAVVFFVSYALGTVGFVIGRALAGDGSLGETAGGLLGLWAGILGGAIVVSRARGTGDVRADYRVRFQPSTDWLFLPVGVLCQVMFVPIYAILELLFNGISDNLEEPAQELVRQAKTPAGFVILFLLLAVGAPLLEELFYRGMLLGALRARMADGWAIVVCGVVFGAVHFQPEQFPGLAVFGVVLAWITVRTGRLGPAVAAHAAFNALTVISLAARAPASPVG